MHTISCTKAKSVYSMLVASSDESLSLFMFLSSARHTCAQQIIHSVSVRLVHVSVLLLDQPFQNGFTAVFRGGFELERP